MDLGLKGLKALVIGGAKGIGAATSQTLAREVADVAICARRADDLTKSVAAPHEMANAAVFLASPAASYSTGTNLVVDSALTKGVQL